MALFKRNTKKEAPAQDKSASDRKPEAKTVTNPAAARPITMPNTLAHVLRMPRITEKVSDLQTKGIYTFDIADGVSKRQVIETVKALYKVTPRKIAVVRIPKKVRRSMRTGKTGVSKGGRKAYVYLKAGETISIH
jgi:ribosomal protein L23